MHKPTPTTTPLPTYPSPTPRNSRAQILRSRGLRSSDKVSSHAPCHASMTRYRHRHSTGTPGAKRKAWIGKGSYDPTAIDSRSRNDYYATSLRSASLGHSRSLGADPGPTTAYEAYVRDMLEMKQIWVGPGRVGLCDALSGGVTRWSSSRTSPGGPEGGEPTPPTPRSRTLNLNYA
jgi:hypothetical protein